MLMPIHNFSGTSPLVAPEDWQTLEALAEIVYRLEQLEDPIKRLLGRSRSVASVTSGTTLVPARVIEVHDDWLMCNILGPIDIGDPILDEFGEPVLDGEGNPTYDGTGEPIVVQERVPVAKPYTLRRSPFDGKRFGLLQFDYDPTDPAPFDEWDSTTQRRVGEREYPDPEDPDEYTVTLEDQVVVPAYVTPIDAGDSPGPGGDPPGDESDGGYDGDIIYIAKAITHVTATANFDDPEGQGYDPEETETVVVEWLDMNVDGRAWAEDNRA